MKRRWLISLSTLALLLSISPRSVSTEAVPEYAMKAVFLYNLALFTEWPELPGSRFNLCIFGNDPFGDTLDKIEGRLIYGRPLTVSHLSSTENLRSCQMLYLGASEHANVGKVLHQLGNAAVLTVTDSPEVMQNDFMIGMSLENKHIVLEINQKAAQSANLAISAKLLRLAKTVQ